MGREIPTKEQTFEIAGVISIPVFKQGAHIKDIKANIIFDIITKSELERIVSLQKEG